MERLSPNDTLRVFVGDGISDQHAAKCANVVFAKDKLASFCEKASIQYAPFDTLAAVAADIQRMLHAGPRAPLPRKVSPVL